MYYFLNNKHLRSFQKKNKYIRERCITYCKIHFETNSYQEVMRNSPTFMRDLNVGLSVSPLPHGDPHSFNHYYQYDQQGQFWNSQPFEITVCWYDFKRAFSWSAWGGVLARLMPRHQSLTSFPPPQAPLLSPHQSWQSQTSFNNSLRRQFQLKLLSSQLKLLYDRWNNSLKISMLINQLKPSSLTGGSDVHPSVCQPRTHSLIALWCNFVVPL